MSVPLETIKPKVRELRAYSLKPYRASIKLNQNENPFDLPRAVKEEVMRRISERAWSRYPEFIPASLLKRLSDFSGWPYEGLLAGNGSNELIQALLLVTLGQGKRVLVCEPTFSLYRQIATVLEADVSGVRLTAELGFDVSGLRRAIREQQPEVTIICSPNNPTGCVISDEDLSMLLSESRGLIAVDEAYHEFAQHSVVGLLGEFKNLVVLRTFSKAMALAGLRVGYLLGDPEIVQQIAKAVLPYNLNVVSQTAATVAIEMYATELRPLIEEIIGERERLFIALQKIEGLDPVVSRANFMVVRSTCDPKRVFSELLDRDILIRDVSSYPMLESYFRVSVGTPQENDLLIGALRQIFS
ncbi:MAG TPA: histidinol-phosphate transaminase [Pyrinomonadaceae bacterium]|nr:histidinol-phosphate transaminase [Pyrinomonadaceae bacterium]